MMLVLHVGVRLVLVFDVVGVDDGVYGVVAAGVDADVLIVVVGCVVGVGGVGVVDYDVVDVGVSGCAGGGCCVAYCVVVIAGEGVVAIGVVADVDSVIVVLGDVVGVYVVFGGGDTVYAVCDDVVVWCWVWCCWCCVDLIVVLVVVLLVLFIVLCYRVMCVAVVGGVDHCVGDVAGVVDEVVDGNAGGGVAECAATDGVSVGDVCVCCCCCWC